ncbi:MAG: hypothetical protein ACRDXC_05300 [Acidimicrobiales bacterium]
MRALAAAGRFPTGPGFTVVLVAHVAAVLIAVIALVAGGVSAARVLTARGELPSSVRSYFSPGVNWTGRLFYLVPVFGAALLAMPGGMHELGAAWVGWGIGLWAAATALAEGFLWPAERRVQRGLAAPDDWALQAAVRGACRTICATTAGVLVLIVAAMVVMVAKP